LDGSGYTEALVALEIYPLNPDNAARTGDLRLMASGGAICPLSGAYLFVGPEMDRYAIFVDAGYLSSQALHILSGKPKNERSELKLQNPAALIAELTKQAQAAFGHDRILRTYWYDGVATSMTTEQTSIAVLPDVQFRAGTIHNRKQKGVDSRIVHDLFELASNRAIADAMVVTGDGDLAVGIEFAQRRGMRVALLSIELSIRARTRSSITMT
jgi:uncharacterized LabA/DUF88 family protein